MDLMRYVLAIAVIIAHVDYLVGFSLPFPFSSFEAVGGFFAISGFLMYPNYVRHADLVKYTRQRARRILPPYIFIVVACAIGFCLVSSLPPRAYFSSNGLLAYLAANLSFLNWLHPDLPGVFQDPAYITPAVNGSLWTMKVEWCLYFSVPCFVWMLSRLRIGARYWLPLAVIMASVAYRLFFTYMYNRSGNEVYDILRRQIFGQLSFFYAGMLVWFVKDFFTKHIGVMLLAGLSLRLLLPHMPLSLQILMEPFAVTAIVLSISLLPWDIRWLRHRRNISYEMYLFHFPLIQLGIWLGIPGSGQLPFWIFAFAATAVLALAVHIALDRCLEGRRH